MECFFGSAGSSLHSSTFPEAFLRCKMKLALICSLFNLFSVVGNASAVDVTYSISGSPGNWNLSFSVTNNLSAWPAQDIYHFGVRLSATNFTGSPGNFAPYSAFWTNLFSGGSSLIYNNTWQDPTFADFTPGKGLSGFIVEIPDITPPAQVEWFAYSATTTSDPADGYTGNEAFSNDGYFAGFEGIASPAATSTPEPATLALVGASLGLLVLRRTAGR